MPRIKIRTSNAMKIDIIIMIIIIIVIIILLYYYYIIIIIIFNHLCRTVIIALESGQEARILQIDFSAAFDRVKHQGILYKFSSVGIGGSVLFVLTQFFSNRSQYVLVDGCRSKLVNVVS